MEKQRDEIEFIATVVLDSSIIIKWFCQEDDTDVALEFRENFTKGKVNIAIPDLVIYEIGNALRYNKTVTQKDVQEAVKSIIDLGIDIIVPTKNVIDTALSLAFEHDITFYDAYYVALAKELNFTFVTADKQLYNKTQTPEFITLLKDFSWL